MANSRQPITDRPRKSLIPVLAAIVLVLGVVLVLVLRPSSSRRSKTEPATDESAQTLTPPAPETPRAPVPPREVIASAPVSAVPQAPPQPQPASPYARQLVNALVQLNMTNGALTPEKLAAWQQALQQLTNAGPAAVPAIREFLQTKQDANFDVLGG